MAIIAGNLQLIINSCRYLIYYHKITLWYGIALVQGYWKELNHYQRHKGNPRYDFKKLQLVDFSLNLSASQHLASVVRVQNIFFFA